MQSASQTSDRSAPVFSLRVSSPHRLRIPIILTAQKESSNVIEKNIWYRVEGNINVTYNESYDEYSELVAITFDGLNYSRKATGTIGKIAFMAADLEYQNALAPDVRNVQEALDDLYKRFN